MKIPKCFTDKNDYYFKKLFEILLTKATLLKLYTC